MCTVLDNVDNDDNAVSIIVTMIIALPMNFLTVLSESLSLAPW